MSGFLYSWGLNCNGQLGHDDFEDRNKPLLVTGLAGCRITGISAGFVHSGAVTSEGKLFTWGHNPDSRIIQKLQYEKISEHPDMDFESPLMKAHVWKNMSPTQ